jgi:hypothetical protein
MDAGDAPYHGAARLEADLARIRRRFVTTDYVVDEIRDCFTTDHHFRQAVVNPLLKT